MEVWPLLCLFEAMPLIVPPDQLIALKALPNSLNVDHLQPLQPHVSYVLSVLLKGEIFFITPESGSRSLNPRNLPREIFIEEGAILPLDINAPKKKGRPTKRDKLKKAKLGMDALDKWLHDTSPPPPINAASSSSSLDASSGIITPIETTLRQYQHEKARILSAVDTQPLPASSSHVNLTLQKSNQFILERLKAAETFFSAESTSGDQSTGVLRVERAVNELGVANAVGRVGGALNLLEGAGKAPP
ncbi:hypothetical protein C0993_001141 [Termitomyces sp. T159_Od127]|nr:hypothetical protein C0993_001141 [Termitomyces sp. T159_Od127]